MVRICTMAKIKLEVAGQTFRALKKLCEEMVRMEWSVRGKYSPKQEEKIGKFIMQMQWHGNVVKSM